MRTVCPNEVDAEIAFAREAATHFAKHPEHNTYSAGDIEPSCFLAIRWGLCDDCVVVVRLDEAHVPTNYMGIVRQVEAAA